MYIQIGGQNIKEYPDLKAFNLFANVISASYQVFLKFDIKEIKKIAIDLTNREIENEVGIFEKTCLIFRRFNFKDYFAKPFTVRQMEILDTLQDSVMLMCDKYGFDKQPFTDAYKKVIEANFEHKVLFNKLSLAKDRRHRAAIEIDLQEDGARVYVLFTDKSCAELVRREVFRMKPNYYFINQLIHKGKWLDNKRYAVSDRNEIVNFVAQPDSENVELDIRPVNMSHEEIMKKLDMLKV